MSRDPCCKGSRGSCQSLLGLPGQQPEEQRPITDHAPKSTLSFTRGEGLLKAVHLHNCTLHLYLNFELDSYPSCKAGSLQLLFNPFTCFQNSDPFSKKNLDYHFYLVCIIKQIWSSYHVPGILQSTSKILIH